MASNIRAMPENEKPPARRVDVYLQRRYVKVRACLRLGGHLQLRNVDFGASACLREEGKETITYGMEQAAFDKT